MCVITTYRTRHKRRHNPRRRQCKARMAISFLAHTTRVQGDKFLLCWIIPSELAMASLVNDSSPTGSPSISLRTLPGTPSIAHLFSKTFVQRLSEWFIIKRIDNLGIAEHRGLRYICASSRPVSMPISIRDNV